MDFENCPSRHAAVFLNIVSETKIELRDDYNMENYEERSVTEILIAV